MANMTQTINITKNSTTLSTKQPKQEPRCQQQPSASAQTCRRHLPWNCNDPQTRPIASRAVYGHPQSERTLARHLHRAILAPLLNKNIHRGPQEQQDEHALGERHGEDGAVKDRADGCRVVEDAPADYVDRMLRSKLTSTPSTRPSTKRPASARTTPRGSTEG